VGLHRVGPRRVGLVERDRVGQDETASHGAGRKGLRGTGRDRIWLYVRARLCLSRPKLAFFRAPFPLSLYNSSLSFYQISIKSREASISVFLQ
jgi:hypothetical protein